MLRNSRVSVHAHTSFLSPLLIGPALHAQMLLAFASNFLKHSYKQLSSWPGEQPQLTYCLNKLLHTLFLMRTFNSPFAKH